MRILLTAFCLAVATAPALAAVDARTQEGPQRKFFCLAYSYIDTWNDWKAWRMVG